NLVLKDPNVAVVKVEGLIPPGARKGDWIDARVTCLAQNKTTSLAHGVLFETDLRNFGANPNNPAGAVNVFARVKGPVVVNPAYALSDASQLNAEGKVSLRTGAVMYNGLVMQDRPIFLQLREPQRRVARAIEERVMERFQKDADRRAGTGADVVAAAQD